jgi:hypothetical protein
MTLKEVPVRTPAAVAVILFALSRVWIAAGQSEPSRGSHIDLLGEQRAVVDQLRQLPAERRRAIDRNVLREGVALPEARAGLQALQVMSRLPDERIATEISISWSTSRRPLPDSPVPPSSTAPPVRSWASTTAVRYRACRRPPIRSNVRRSGCPIGTTIRRSAAGPR